MKRPGAQRRRAAAKVIAFQKTNDTTELLENALDKARKALTDKAFHQLLHAHGVHFIPRVLWTKAPVGAAKNQAPDALVLDCSLKFVLAWTLLFPLFKKPDVAKYLDTAWPGFIQQMKDAFIAVVVDGPFPHSMSGHRGRRHQGFYNPSPHRHPIIRRQSR